MSVLNIYNPVKGFNMKANQSCFQCVKCLNWNGLTVDGHVNVTCPGWAECLLWHQRNKKSIGVLTFRVNSFLQCNPCMYKYPDWDSRANKNRVKTKTSWVVLSDLMFKTLRSLTVFPSISYSHLEHLPYTTETLRHTLKFEIQWKGKHVCTSS